MADLTSVKIKTAFKRDRLNVWWGFGHNQVNLEAWEKFGDSPRLTNITLERAEALELAETLLRAVRALDNREATS